MFRHLFPFRRLLATSFLLVFVNVFVGQCFCATMNPVMAAPISVAKATPAPKPSHPGCHGHSQAKKQPVKAKQDSKSDGTSDKSGCCKDNAAAVLKSLTTPSEKQLLSPPAPAVLPAGSDYFFRPAAGTWDRTHSVVLVLREHLPPKIPDIRIYIQSLTV